MTSPRRPAADMPIAKRRAAHRAMLVALLSAAVAGAAAAETAPSIPEPVVAQCASVMASRQHEMSDCLRHGAIAFDLLRLAAEEEFYGAAAERVIAGCGERNETYRAIWICFRTAAKEAAETRGLIGLESMPDACYAGISDPDTLERIQDAEDEAERAMFGDWYSSGFDNYHPLRECPPPAGSAASDRTAGEGGGEANVAGTVAEDAGPGTGGISPEACAAYAGLEAFLAARETGELEAVVTAVQALPENRRLEGLVLLGVPEDALAFAQGAGEGEAIGLAFIGAALLRRHHPELFDAYLASPAVPGELGSLGAAMLDGLLALALEGYEEGCGGPDGG